MPTGQTRQAATSLPAQSFCFTAPLTEATGGNCGRRGRSRRTSCLPRSRCSAVCSTNNCAGSTMDWKACSTVTAETDGRPNCWDWIRRPWRATVTNYSAARCCKSVFEGPVAGVISPWEKNLRNPEYTPCDAGDRHSWRSAGTAGRVDWLAVAQIRQQLRRLGLRVCANTVGRLLGKLGYALHANRKSLGQSHLERDRQFRYLVRQRRRFAAAQALLISVSTKKRNWSASSKVLAAFGAVKPYRCMTTISCRSATAAPHLKASTMSRPITTARETRTVYASASLVP